MMKKVLVTIAAGAVLASGCSHDKSEASILDWFKPKTTSVQNADDAKLAALPFDASKYPNNYANIGNGKTTLSASEKALIQKKGNRAFQQYSNLDVLGRGQKGVALVDYKTVLQHSSSYLKQNGLLYGDKKIYKRPDFPSYVHVSGEYYDGVFDKYKQRWKGTKSNNKMTQLSSYRGWMYNKSHTIAWSLGGDMETHNVTLGTRSQNVGKNDGKGGMGYPETKIRNAVYNKKDTKVFYEVTPVYKGNELVPRGSHVRAYSINDGGKTVNMNIYVFNVEKGKTINYMNGSFK